jgi:hypothetical protein
VVNFEQISFFGCPEIFPLRGYSQCSIVTREMLKVGVTIDHDDDEEAVY